MTPRLLELPTPFEDERGVIRVLEPADCDRARLIRRLRAGTYDRPFVADDGKRRTLHFHRDFLQSSMRLADPEALEFGYTRKIMAFLLFVPEPRDILLLGLGGGSLAKYCRRHLDGASLTVVENDPDVLAFRGQFLVPEDDARFCVVLDEGARFVEGSSQRRDVIVVDAFDRDGCPPAISSPAFYVAAHRTLARGGVLVANMVGERAERREHLDVIRTAFDDSVILLPVIGEGNHLVFAFRDAGFEPGWRALARRARELRERHGLDFPGFLDKLERSSKMGYVRRASSR